MPSLSIKLKTVSPLFLSGADKDQPELRAASVRGQLRYWFRAIMGTRIVELSKIWEREQNVFGSTEKSSVVSIRVYGRPSEPTGEFLLPHRSERRSPQKAIAENSPFQLHLCTPPGIEIPQEAFVSLKIWLLLGGLGKRSRRMMGALSATNFWEPALEEPQTFITECKKTISTFAPDPEKLSRLYNQNLPSFPTLHPNHSRIVIGKKDFHSAQEANIALFSILRSNEFRQHEWVFGHAMQGRRASPLIAQVRKIGRAYYPVLTIMRSSDIKDREWGILNDFMSQCEQKFDGESVWGGRLAK